jgi:predicted nucleic acid-binding protein
MSVRKFFDSSAIVKLYVTEPDTPAVQAEMLTCDEVLISRLTPPEYRSAIYGKVREKNLSAADAGAALAAFSSSLGNFTVLQVSEAVWQRTELLLDSYAVSNKLRPPDAVQLACALEENALNPIDAFVTADVDQRAVALALGFVVAP